MFCLYTCLYIICCFVPLEVRSGIGSLVTRITDGRKALQGCSEQNRSTLWKRTECCSLLRWHFGHFTLSVNGSNLTNVFRNVGTLIHCISQGFISCRECQYTQIVQCQTEVFLPIVVNDQSFTQYLALQPSIFNFYCFVCLFVFFKLLCSPFSPPPPLYENCSFMVIVIVIYLCYLYFLIILIFKIVTISKYNLGILDLMYIEILFLFQHLKIKLSIVLLFVIIINISIF